MHMSVNQLESNIITNREKSTSIFIFETEIDFALLVMEPNDFNSSSAFAIVLINY